MAPHIKTAGNIALGAACFPSAVIAGSALQLGSRLGQLAARVAQNGKIVHATKNARLIAKWAWQRTRTKNSWNAFQKVAHMESSSAKFVYWNYKANAAMSGINSYVPAYDFAGAILNPGYYPIGGVGVAGNYIQKKLSEWLGF